MDNKAGNTIVKAEVAIAEMLTYGADLTSMTQGREASRWNAPLRHLRKQRRIRLSEAKAERWRG